MGGLGRRRIIRLAVVGITAAIILLAACDGDETPTPTPTPTAPPPSTETPAPTAAPRRTAPTAPWDLINTLIKPLLNSPRRIVHNGFSPLNLIWNNDRLVVIDWETLAVAPPEIDFADLLTFPDWGAPDRMVHRAAEVIGNHRLRLETFWAASAERSLTYAATAHVRSHRLRSTNPTLADAYQLRLPRYLHWFQLAATELVSDTTSRHRLRAVIADLRQTD